MQNQNLNEREIEFLKESNAIEGVYDDDSLQQAIYAWEYLKEQDALTIGVILKTHKILMLNQPLRPNEKGYFRKVPVWIGGRKGLDHKFIEPAIWKWTFEVARAYPRVDAAALHVEYENIHPFVDGNGRTGRMFWNWTRLKRTGESILVIKESERQEYYKMFQ